MGTDISAKKPKGSWSKKVVKKWLNLRTSNPIYGLGDEVAVEQEGKTARRRSCSDKDDAVSMPGGLSAGTAPLSTAGDDGWWGSDPKQNPPEHVPSPIANAVKAKSPPAGTQTLRMFVGTWNVGGRAPHAGLNLRDWLSTPAPADIYVLGFQEVVPLNAGNVLGTEDKGPAARWLSLIRQALNSPKRASTSAGNCTEDAAATAAVHPDQFQRTRVSFSDLISIEDMLEEEEADVDEEDDAYETTSTDPSSSDEESVAAVVPVSGTPERRRRRRGNGAYCLAASKQMVGIFLCVWVRADLLPHVTRVKASCVARGIMRYMGNKGSISISMTLRQTTFCFVCTHLASGEKDKDEVRRNSDVVEILRRTRFPSSRCGGAPKTILQHSKIIWLGDLNYRLSSICGDTHELLQKSDWGALLEKDQLKLEQKAGKIFTGWEEGRIYFPPTYKYLTNSDRYAVQTFNTREKRRTPAWCDRILWKGEGMKQICYVRGESRFSDHRPVYSIFSVRVPNAVVADSHDCSPAVTSNSGGNKKKGYRIRWPMRITGNSTTTGPNLKLSSNSSNGGANSSARVLAEEMFPITRSQSCLETSRF